MIWYMIRHKETGQWSKGGMDLPKEGMGRGWTEKKRWGKVWKGTGPLKNHLNQYSEVAKARWEIVEVEVNLDE